MVRKFLLAGKPRDEVLDGLDPDRIVLLHEEQQDWQAECAPRRDKLEKLDFFETVIALAGWESGQPDPLRHLRPTTRQTLLRTLAEQYTSSLMLSSSSTSSPASTAKPL